MADFPHLNDSDFPLIGNVDVYKYKNDYDYSAFDDYQMTVTLCTVPWDMGEAHVGQRTVSGIGNVVYFEEGKDGRDLYFSKKTDRKVFFTNYRKYHDTDTIDVPLPFDACAKYNYVYIEYSYLPSQTADTLLDYETKDGTVQWFYFIRDIKRKSNNSTQLAIKRDIWQTVIYDVEIPYMMLERGHAPMAQNTASEFLTSPCTSTRYLMADDVNFGAPAVVRDNSRSYALNNTVWACIACTSDPQGDWSGSTPCATYYTNNGAPATVIFALETSKFNAFLDFVDSNYPQFKQTVLAVFFLPQLLVTETFEFLFAGNASSPSLYFILTMSPFTYTVPQLTIEDFDYPDEYAEIAKLYTYPYAVLEVTDERGNTREVHIEDTTGNLAVTERGTIAYPDVSIFAIISGIGGDASKTITFRNIDTHTLDYSGAWYGCTFDWDVPTFAVCQDAGTFADFSTQYMRTQDTDEANLRYTATDIRASADSAVASYQASGIRTNATYNSDLETNLASATTSTNSSITTTSNAAAVTDTSYGNGLNQALQAWSAGYTRETTNNEIDYSYASAAVGATTGAVQSIAGGVASGTPAGLVSGIVDAACSGVNTAAQTVLSANLTSTQAEAGIEYTQAQVDETNQNNSDKVALQTSTQSSITSLNNSLTSMQAAYRASNIAATADTDASTMTKSASEVYNATVDAAGRQKTVELARISNTLAQRGMDAPKRFGAASADSGSLKPMLVQINVVTQSDGAIAMAGDQFLRYGYRYDGAWNFETFNLMPRFTYWKCSDVWVKNLQLPDLFMDELRYLLLGGVTVWSDPEDIGNTSIYENV